MRKEIVLETLREELEHAQKQQAKYEARAQNGISSVADNYAYSASALRLAISLVELMEDDDGGGK